MASCGPFDPDRRVLAAVSGGADSMALAVLLSSWGNPLAAIVDHGLRPDSAAEADLTAARLARLRIPTRILRARLTPGPAAAERARDARYRLLLAVCRESGLPDLILAHHQADQAETVLMRAESGSAPTGLAGMPAIAHRTEARLLRPLLSIAPSRLRATLRAAGLDWVEDPTNTDLRFRRPALRAAITEARAHAALELAEANAAQRAATERQIAAELAACTIRPEGVAHIPIPISAAALAALIRTISGREHPPPRAALADGLRPRTLAGTVITPAGRLGPGVLLAREPAALAPPIPATDGAIWDERFRLLAPDLATPDLTTPDLTLAALGPAAAALRRHSPLPALVLRTLPSIWRGAQLVAVPHLGFPDPDAWPKFRCCFVPRLPAAGAPFR